MILTVLLLASALLQSSVILTSNSSVRWPSLCSKTTAEGLVRVELLWSLGQPLPYWGTFTQRGTRNYCAINWIYFIAWINFLIYIEVATSFLIYSTEDKWSFQRDKQLHHHITTISKALSSNWLKVPREVVWYRVTGVGDRLAAETGTMSSLAYATTWANKRSCCSAKPGDGSTTPSNNNNNNINNNNKRLYLERVKTLKQ